MILYKKNSCQTLGFLKQQCCVLAQSLEWINTGWTPTIHPAKYSQCLKPSFSFLSVVFLFNRINHICWGSVVLWLSVLTAKLLFIFLFYSTLKLWPLRIFPRLSAEKHYSYSNWHSCVEKVVFPLPKQSMLCQTNSLTLTVLYQRKGSATISELSLSDSRYCLLSCNLLFFQINVRIKECKFQA